MSKLPDEAFRDTIGTIDERAREIYFPKSRRENSMTIASGLYFAYFGCKSVFNKWKPFMLFNVFERRFNIFGFPFGQISTSSLFMIVGCLCDFVYGYFWTYFLWMDLSSNLEMVLRSEYWIGDQGAKLDYQNKLLKN
jgi:hypothetical protein